MHLTMINTLRRRRSVPEQLFYDYWRDAHVSIACRLPGIHDLWTHALSFERGGRWPPIMGIDGCLRPTEWFDGVPEPAFLTADDVSLFVEAMGPLMADEDNLFEETISYQSLGDNSTTYVDRLDPTPNGRLDATKFFVFLRHRDGVDQPALRRYLTSALAPRIAEHPLVRKFRLHLLEEYVDSDVLLDAGSSRVSHRKTKADQYQAVYEIAFRDPLAMREFHSSSTWTESQSEQREYLAAAHAALITHTYTWRYHGELTLAGLRTSAVAEQIRALGATNQLTPQVNALIAGRG